MAATRRFARRRPEEARTAILDAADGVFARSLPDAVGIRDIARAAKVSHALVTHYFGTYDALIDAVIERRLAAARATVFARVAQATFAPTESPLVDILMDMLADATLMRLLAWSMMMGRSPIQGGRQLGQVLDAMHARLGALGIKVDRARLELSVVLAVSMVAGWAIVGPTLARAAGRTYPHDELRRELHRMIRAYVAAP